MEVERIKFERTGGFTGMRIARDLKLKDLPEEQADTIVALLEDLDFEELPAQMINENESALPDQFTYTITVETKRGEHTVVTGEASAPEKMQELLHLLDRLARTKKKL